MTSRLAPGVVAVGTLAALLAACAGPRHQSPRHSGPVTSQPAGTSTQDMSTSGYTNPVYSGDFPDPDIITVAGKHYAFATNGRLGNVQALASPDLVRWTPGADALPTLPRWTVAGKVWAPEVAVHGSHRYVLYYTSQELASGRQAIGVAVATSPAGPYKPVGSRPLVTQPGDGGSIDASPFLASDGARYLYWKNDGNAIGKDTWIQVQRLSPDGLALTGKPVRLFKQTEAWEDSLVEAPHMFDHAGALHLFYSANAYDSGRYAVGDARCHSPLGPCTKLPGPVLRSSDVAAGPGHCTVFEDAGRTWMAYHAWPPDAVGSMSPGRQMWLSEVTWRGEQPMVGATKRNSHQP